MELPAGAAPGPALMRVAVNGRFLCASHPGGVHRAGRRLVEHLATRDLDLEVLTPAGCADPMSTRQVWAPGRSTAALQAWEQLVLPVVARDRFLLSLANTGPVAARNQALFLYDLASAHRPDWFRAQHRVLMRTMLATARRARLVFVAAEAVRGELLELGLRTPVVVVPLAVDPSFQPAPPAEVAALAARLGVRRPYVLHVGWGDPRKNVETAIEAHRRACVEEAHDLVLVGSPHPYFAPVAVDEAPTVHRVGRVSDADLRGLLTGAAALLYPSRYEGFGLPPLEALACGTPAVVSDIPVLRETVASASRFVGADDVDGWAHAILAALRGDLPVGPLPTWSWNDAAARMAAALDSAGAGR